MWHRHTPNPIRHVNVLPLLVVNGSHEVEIALKALGGEQPVNKGVDEALVKVVVDAATVDALGEQSAQSTPGHLVRGQVGATLRGGGGGGGHSQVQGHSIAHRQ